MPGTVRRMFHSDDVLDERRHDRLSPAIHPRRGDRAAVADAAGKGVRRAFLGAAPRPSPGSKSSSWVGALRATTPMTAVARPASSWPVPGRRGLLHLERPRWDFWTTDGRPARFRLYAFSLLDFGPYPDFVHRLRQAAYVREMMRFLGDPEGFGPAGAPVLVPTRFVPARRRDARAADDPGPFVTRAGSARAG